MDALKNNPNFPDHPDRIEIISTFETPSNFGDGYGQRVYGWLEPPETGNYIFYLSSDDSSELYLSEDDSPANVRLIASEPLWNSSRDWLTPFRRPNGENISEPIYLEKGQQYYIEALHKEGAGGDHLAVTWQTQDQDFPRIGDPPLQRHLFSEIPVSINTSPLLSLIPDLFLDPGETQTLAVSLRDNESELENLQISLQLSHESLLSNFQTMVDSQAGTLAIDLTAHADASGLTYVKVEVVDEGGFSVEQTFRVWINNTATVAQGGLLREVFLNQPGHDFPSEVNMGVPDLFEIVQTSETQSNYGESYAQRLSGYIKPPVTGDYQFYVSSDDRSAVYLSTDADPLNTRLIAFEPSWNPVRDWTSTVRRPNQENISDPIHLEAGQFYYLEILHAEGNQGDHLGMTWQLPGDPVPSPGDPPIASEFLYFPDVNTNPRFSTIPNQTLVYDQTISVPFSLEDDQTLPANLIVNATSSNQALISNDDLVIQRPQSAGEPWFLDITPIEFSEGKVTVNLSAQDEGGLTRHAFFDVFLHYSGSKIFWNDQNIQINDLTTANPYPSSIYVEGLENIGLGVRVGLDKLTHTWPEDISMLLVGPDGRNVMLMGGLEIFDPVSQAQIIFDDLGAPLEEPLTSGTYQPYRTEFAAQLPGFGPVDSYGYYLDDWAGSNPNGAWQLYIVDDLSADTGMIEGGWWLEFLNTEYSPDTQAPVITDFSIVPGELAFENRFDSFGFNFHLQDDYAGIQEVQIRFVSPNNNFLSFGYSGGYGLINGTIQDGDFEFTANFDLNWEIFSGFWAVDEIIVKDYVGRRSFWNNSMLNQAGFSTGINIIPPLSDDTEPPQLIGFDFHPKTIDTSQGAVDVILTYHAADNQSGLESLGATFRSPDGSTTLQFHESPAVPVSGDLNDGVFEKTLTFPQGSDPGIWDLFNLALGDKAENLIEWSQSELDQQGFPNQLEILSGDQVIIQLGSVSVQTGGEVLVPVSVRHFNQIAGVQLTFGWDASKLDYIGIENLNLEDLTQGNFSSGNTGSGILTLSWNDSDLAGVTVVDDTEILAIRFQAIGQPGEQTWVSIINDPTPLEVSEVDGDNLQNVSSAGLPGLVSFLSTVNLSGSVLYWNNSLSVPGVAVEVENEGGNHNLISDNDGRFGVTVDAGSDYTFRPRKATDIPANQGVSTLDILLTRRHILDPNNESTHLGNPYQLLAADVNRSGSVSTLDILLMRRLILDPIQFNYYITDQDVWQIMPATHSFGNPSAPWAPPGLLNLPEVATDRADLDFTAVKLGDVNGNWTFNEAAQLQSARNRQGDIQLWLESPVLEEEHKNVNVNVRVNGAKGLTSLQFTLKWDPEILRFNNVGSYGLEGMGEEHISFAHTEAGFLTVAWEDESLEGVNLQSGTILLELSFEIIDSSRLPVGIEWASYPTPQEATLQMALNEAMYLPGLISQVAESSGRWLSIKGGLAHWSEETGTEIRIWGQSGHSYYLEANDALPGGAWRRVMQTGRLDRSGMVQLKDDEPSVGGNRFYRWSYEVPATLESF